MDASILFQPLQMGTMSLPNRVLMAPLTRNRSQADGTPRAMAVDYYRQRAAAGLIITEATNISPRAKGYLDTPGIFASTHVDAWRPVTEAVHAGGGRIFLQLWHVGRVSHTSLQPGGAAPMAPSAIRAKSKTFTAEGFQDCSEPQAMSLDEIRQTIAEYRQAARNAVEAGFDGVEVHAANGYLIDQFLQDSTNRRKDEYGGTVDKRIRFLDEVLQAVCKELPASRVGVRLSPLGQFNDMGDSDPQELFLRVIQRLNNRGMAYLHVVEQFPGTPVTDDASQLLDGLHDAWKGLYIANGGFDAEKAASCIQKHRADAVSFGRPFISNPDLPERFRRGAALNDWDQDTFYGGGRPGYTDYPFLPMNLPEN